MKFYWIDSFADRPFAGNPAGVCLLSKPVTDEWMQAFAKEIALSETAFVLPKEDEFDLRWFTPSIEVKLCGHATLASAHALWQSGLVKQDRQIKFHSKSGTLFAEKKEDLIWLDFPAFETRALEAVPKYLLEALNVNPIHLAEGQDALLLEIDSEQTLRSIRPDFELLAQVPYGGIIVTCLSQSNHYDFVSRYFGPREGINEDPVTGFAHCHLGPYWHAKLGKSDLYGYQASPRGGAVRIQVQGTRARLGGNAVSIFRGDIVV